MMDNRVDITGFNGDFASMLLLPYMAHPDDVDKRERLQAWLWAKIAVKGGPELTIEMLRRLTEAAEIGVGDDLENATAGGCMAGDVLFALLGMANGGLKDGGIDKACHVVSTVYQTSEDGRGQSFKAGRDTVKNNWEKYRNVAHLWAAHMIQVRESEENGTSGDYSMWSDGCNLAARAHSLQSLAANFTTPRMGGAILPDTALKIVGAPLVPVPLPSLDAPVFKALENFKSRFRD